MNKTFRTILIVFAVLLGAAFVIAIGVFILSGFGGGFLHHPMVMEGYRNFQSPDGRFPAPRMMSGYSPFGFFGGILARLAGFGLLAVLIGLLVWGASRLFNSQSTFQPHSSGADGLGVQEILDRRYARGEINRDEYLQVLKDTGHPVPPMAESPNEPPAET